MLKIKTGTVRILVYAVSIALPMLIFIIITNINELNHNTSIFKENNSLDSVQVNPVKFEIVKTILFWTDCIGISCVRKYGMPSGEVKCGLLQRKCYVTEDRKLFPNSSAVIFDARAQSQSLCLEQIYQILP